MFSLWWGWGLAWGWRWRLPLIFLVAGTLAGAAFFACGLPILNYLNTGSFFRFTDKDETAGHARSERFKGPVPPSRQKDLSSEPCIDIEVTVVRDGEKPAHPSNRAKNPRLLGF